MGGRRVYHPIWEVQQIPQIRIGSEVDRTVVVSIKKQSNRGNSQNTVIIDHRENAEVLTNGLRAIYHVDIAIEQLELGDYKIFPDTLVERKTIDDFCLSIIDGRLFKQAYRLAHYTQNPVLLLEGETFKSRQYDMIWHSMPSKAHGYRWLKPFGFQCSAAGMKKTVPGIFTLC